MTAYGVWQAAAPQPVTEIVAAADAEKPTLPIVNRAIKADLVGSLRAWPKLSSRSAFGRLWADDEGGPAIPPTFASYSDEPAPAPAPRARVYFAYADTVDDISSPFAALFANPGVTGTGLPKDDVLPLASRGAEQTKCLAEAIYFEARGESRRGQLAVAQVIINRVKNPAFPKTICGVVYQGADELHRCQFSFACDGSTNRITDRAAWLEAMGIAREVVDGGRSVVMADIGNATHYHATYVSPRWADRMKMMDQIGHHVFYAPCKTCSG